MDKLILAIDQGTSGTKALLFNAQGRVVKKGMAALFTNYMDNGFVEQEPMAIIESVQSACANCLEGIDPSRIVSIGISNQRETFVLWDQDGNAVTPAIVWACKRSTEICASMMDQSDWIAAKTGLKVDPYFSGTKLLWLLQQDPILLKRVQNKEIYFGTVDTWLLYQLTNGKSYYTDYTNASRTLLFNLQELSWDQSILEAWNLKGIQLPEVKPSGNFYGETNLFELLPTPITIDAMIGDSHAAMFGECCFEIGSTKMTLGTGCSMLMHIGKQPKVSNNGLLTTIGWSTDQEVVYAWEGAIVACGSMISWLKESLHVFEEPSETENIAKSIPDNGGVYIVPAFSGLGAPYWDMNRRASIVGLNFGTQSAHIVRATLESICFQIQDIILALENDLGENVSEISMHGGLSHNRFLQEQLADLMNSRIAMQHNADISAQGAAYLAGLTKKIYPSLDALKTMVQKEVMLKTISSSEIKTQYWRWKEIVTNNQF